eukprot:2654052-Pleurochrysis_carterae.AAC.1
MRRSRTRKPSDQTAPCNACHGRSISVAAAVRKVSPRHSSDSHDTHRTCVGVAGDAEVEVVRAAHVDPVEARHPLPHGARLRDRVH